MRIRDYFPLGIAYGQAFCNRTEETKVLVDNIKHGKHTLLMASRRYGKSSLALHALAQSKLPFVEVDFFLASSEKMVEAYVLKGVIDLIGKALGPVEKLVASIKKYLQTLKPKLNVGGEQFTLELSSDNETDPATHVMEGLMLLEKLLAEKNKYAVFLMDEFQMVGVIAQGKGIEAAIRHVAQKTKHLTILFSGSNRKLLQTMFEDENRPLYKLCWKLTLSRISLEHYHNHLQHAAKLFWKQPMPEAVFDAIMRYTERHPYFVNKLCDRLLIDHATKPPSLHHVDAAWQQMIEEEKSDVVKEISLLSAGQKVVLMHIVQHPNLLLTSKQSMLAMQMTSSSIITALEGLEEKDIIERLDHGYQVINPIVKCYALK